MTILVLFAATIGKAVWVTFALGVLLHILKRADTSAKSKLSGIRSIGHFLEWNWIALLIRAALGVALFEMLWTNPKFFGDEFQVPWLERLPFGWGFALMIGFFQDSIVDWVFSKIPFLQKELPKIADAVDGPVTSGAAAGSG
jgi:hypothetical protein